jgi:hypothetical protein
MVEGTVPSKNQDSGLDQLAGRKNRSGGPMMGLEEGENVLLCCLY